MLRKYFHRSLAQNSPCSAWPVLSKLGQNAGVTPVVLRAPPPPIHRGKGIEAGVWKAGS